MRVRFWGTRGSIPIALNAAQMRSRVVNALRRGVRTGLRDEDVERFVDEDLSFHERATFGGNSSCVEIEIPGEDYILCDAGSGLREFGNSAFAKHGPSNPQTYHLFQSHLHWDHIMGFPFFTPAYIPGNRVVVYSCHHEARDAFRSQQSAPSFPVDFSALGATIDFVEMQPGTAIQVGGISVTSHHQNHGGDSYGYRFEHADKAVVYSTDGEHKLESREDTAAMIDFYRGADLVIFDAMYSLADAITVKEDWGHSSNIVGVDLCLRAEVKHYCMFHHEPVYDDEMIEQVLGETRRYEEIARLKDRLEVSAAYDGLEIDV